MASSTRSLFALFAIIVLVNGIIAKECDVIPREDVNNAREKFDAFKDYCHESNVQWFMGFPGLACQSAPRIGKKKIYGVLSYYFEQEGTWAYLSVICVHDNKQGKGIGKQLMETWVNMMRNNSKVKLLYAWVRNDNAAAQVLLSKFGFQQKKADRNQHKWELVLKEDDSGEGTSGN
ncbi:acetyltransferase (GNAT) family domain-containing protein [Ditylenchus destructor]|nr:acetyltransferase (GNAT) family domain-containing protein [Ditylenchus destructor]